MSIKHWSGFRLIAAAALFACAIVAGASPLAPSARPTTSAAAWNPEIAELLRDFDRACRVAGRTLDRLAREEFDPAVRAEMLGSDSEAIYRWVRDETTWLPSRGVLRGARGVLMDGLGSHADRALLLATLLLEAGRDVRLVRATLDDAAARALADHWRETAPPTIDETAESIDQAVLATAIDDAAASLKMPREAVEGRVLTALAAERQRADAARLRVLAIGDALAAVLPPRTAVNDRRTGLLAAAADLWWVEYRPEGANAWASLDPSRRDHTAGEAPSDIDGTLARFAIDELPEDDVHHVDVAVEIVRAEGDGTFTRETAFREGFQAPELTGEHIALGFLPLPTVMAPDWATTDVDGARREAFESLRSIDEWAPVLRVDTETFMQSSIYSNGTLNENPNLLSATDRKVTKAAEALSDLGGGRAETQLVAVELVIARQSPGSDEQRAIRTLFDLRDPETRAYRPTEGDTDERLMGFLTYTEMLVQTGWFAPSFVQDKALRALESNRRPLIDWLYAANQGDPPRVFESVREIDMPPGRLYELALAREHWSTAARRVAPTRPNIVALHANLRIDGSTAERTTTIDIIDNTVGPRAGVEDPFAARFRQGISDTLFEAIVLRRERGTDQPIANTALAFEEDLIARRVWTAEADDAGWWIVRPDAGGDLVWRIDAATGATLGIGPEGRGQALMEEVATQAASMYGVLKALSGIMDCADPGMTAEETACCTRQYAITGMVGIGYGEAIGRTGMSAIGSIAAGVVLDEAGGAAGKLSPCK